MGEVEAAVTLFGEFRLYQSSPMALQARLLTPSSGSSTRLGNEFREVLECSRGQKSDAYLHELDTYE
jgi:hypothetical protein